MKAFEVFFQYHNEPISSEVVWCFNEAAAMLLVGLAAGERIIKVLMV